MESELTDNDERTLKVRLIKDNGAGFDVVVKGKQVTEIGDAIQVGEGFKFYDYGPSQPGGHSIGPGSIVAMFVPEIQMEKGYECSQK